MLLVKLSIECIYIIISSKFFIFFYYEKKLISLKILFAAQESTGKLGVLGPTKIYLAVQPQGNTAAQPPPLSPMNQSSQQQQQQVSSCS